MTNHADTAKDGRRYRLTFKQEAFCRAFVYEHEGNASAAYRQVYDCTEWKDETVWRAAARLMAMPKVRTEIEKLQEQARKRTATTVDSITDKLGAAYTMAESEKQSSAMTSAALGEAKLHGLLIEKREVKVTTADMTDAQIDAELVAIREERDDHLVTPIVTPGEKSKLTH